MTDPAGTVVLEAVVIAPTVNCAFVIAVVAAACVSPTTFGTAICGGPDETVSATALPTATDVPAAGDWLITDPSGRVPVVPDAVHERSGAGRRQRHARRSRRGATARHRAGSGAAAERDDRHR